MKIMFKRMNVNSGIFYIGSQIEELFKDGIFLKRKKEINEWNNNNNNENNT